MSLSARAIAVGGLGFGAALTAVNGLRDVLEQVISSTGGGKFKPRKPSSIVRPAWLKPIIWATPENPLADIQPDAIIGDAALLIRKRLLRRQKDEAELLMLGLI